MQKLVCVLWLTILCLSLRGQGNSESILSHKIDSLIQHIDTNDVDFEENALKKIGNFAFSLADADYYDTLEIIGSTEAEHIENEIRMLYSEDQETIYLDPDEMTFLLIDLTDLNNQYTADDVSKFQNLQTLIICGNPPVSNFDIQSLFSGLQTLSISELYIINCKDAVSYIPDNIGNLKTIQKLGLYGNELSYLPESICDLTSLEELYVDINPIGKLPNGIGNLTSLKELGIAKTKVEYAELMRIKNLVPQCNVLTQ